MYPETLPEVEVRPKGSKLSFFMTMFIVCVFGIMFGYGWAMKSYQVGFFNPNPKVVFSDSELHDLQVRSWGRCYSMKKDQVVVRWRQTIHPILQEYLKWFNNNNSNRLPKPKERR